MASGPEPPYLKIAAELRRRIADGELKPGDRVPSTRKIASEWGVAIATATKALTALHQQGLIQSRPRVGTVVAAPSAPRADPGGDELSRDAVVRAAIAIADAEGLDALSMRGIAARLGVATMSTYRYVTSKDDLVLWMADAAFGEEGYPSPPPKGWRARLELGGRTMWRLYVGSPGTELEFAL